METMSPILLPSPLYIAGPAQKTTQSDFPRTQWLQLWRQTPRMGGAGVDHSLDVSGRVCPLRLCEDPSTCPRNVGC